MMATTGNQPAAEDAQAYLSWLDARADVAGPEVGVVGFCMGSGMALTIAGTYDERIAAAASYYGDQFATDDPTSPHLLAPQMEDHRVLPQFTGRYPPVL